MSQTTERRVQELFGAALDRPAPERAAYLREACGGDDELRARIEALLAAHERADAVLGRPTAWPTASRMSEELPAGGRIGQYHLKRAIATGGMGVVYEAQQERPRRTVALKLMRDGIASRSALRRFEYEAQILARLQHPNIAQIHEAGTHEAEGTGRKVPFFAMEYVPNARPLVEYAQEARLGTRERLDLFIKVCAAVHHGHQKGIIHRDLKPSNILVDSAGEPKIIDFGVARATDSDLAVTTLQTDVGQLIGTLQYMSPEQCAADPHDLDTRSDVYALGVVLYELLSDQLPYDVSRVALHEAARVIREDAPARPSTINRTLRGDLETVTLKALEKDRARRYQSAVELADDLERYLKSEPIVARRPSVGYQVRLFARRHKAAFGAIAVTAAALVLAAIVSVVFAVRAGIAERDALAAEQREREAKDDALRQAAEIEHQRDEIARQRDELEWRFYVTNVVAADAALREHDLDLARLRLEQSPEPMRGWEWQHLRTRAVDPSVAVLSGHTGNIRTVAFAPDGRRLASGSIDGTIRLWDLARAEQIAELRPDDPGIPDTNVRSLALTPDGARIVSAHNDSKLRLWEVESGRQLASWRVDANETPIAQSVSISPDGRRIASGHLRGSITVWDAASRSALRTMSHAGHVQSVTFSPDGRRLASGGNDRMVRVWDVATGDEIMLLEGHGNQVWSVRFSPDGTLLATGAHDQQVRIWDAASGALLRTLHHEDYVYALEFSPDGRRLVSGSEDGRIQVWDPWTGDHLRTLHGHRGLPGALAFSADGGQLASGSQDRTVRLWDMDQLDAQSTDGIAVMTHDRELVHATFSPDGSRIAAAAWDDSVVLWDAQTHERLVVFPEAFNVTGDPAIYNKVRFSPDGNVIAAARRSDIVLRSTFTGEELAVLPDHESWVDSLEFSPDGRHLVSGSRDKTVILWDLETNAPVRVMGADGTGHEHSVNDVAFSPDGRLIASASWDGTVRLWDAGSGSPLSVFVGHEGYVLDVAFSPNGRLLASGSADGTVRIWSMRAPHEPQEPRVLRGHKLSVLGVTFSPDGSRLASCSADHRVKIWDVERDVEVLTLRGHEHWVFSVDFSPDGTRLLTASWDRTARVWDLVPSRERSRQRGEARRLQELVRPTVDRLFAEGEMPPSILASLSANTSLSERGRHAALNELLKRVHDEELLQRRRRQADARAECGRLLRLGDNAEAIGKLERAEQLYREARRVALEGCGREHRQTGWAHIYLALLLKDLGPERLDEAETVAREALEIFRAVDGDAHTLTLNARETLASVWLAQGRIDDALAEYDALEQPVLAAVDQEHWLYGAHLAGKGRCLLNAGRFAEAEPLMLEGYAVVRAAGFATGRGNRTWMRDFVRLYEGLGDADEARAYRDELDRLEGLRGD
jgi:WD40 repeat protein/tRNA A-37 threonylcarbamoyl transferase component Bud32